MISYIDLYLDFVKKLGYEILELRKKGLNRTIKSDRSILTNADVYASEKIIKFLEETFSIPVLSEEKLVDFNVRKNWTKFFIIDPIDGTKQYFKGTGDFTINIALIEDNKPIFGLIYNPLTEEFYYAQKSMGVYKNVNGMNKKLTSKIPRGAGLVVNKSFNEELYKKKIEKYMDNYMLIRKSSSYKFCLLADGRADCYLRFSPIHTWDIAAGDIIVTEAGYKVTDLNLNKIDYNSNSYNLNGVICIFPKKR